MGFGPDRRRGGRAREAGSYRGPDRRRQTGDDHTSPLSDRSRLFVLIGCGLAAGLIGLGGALWPSLGGPLAGVIRPGAPVIACMAAVLMVSRWRRDGETRSAVLALIALLLFGVHPIVGQVLMAIRPAPSESVWLDTAVVVVSFLALAIELRSPPIDTTRRLGRLVLVVAGSIALLSVALEWLIGPTRWSGLSLWATAAGQARWAPAVLALGALVLGGLMIGRAPSRSVPIDRWFGLALVPWGWSEVLVAAYPGHLAVILTAAALRLAGMVVLAWGAIDAVAQETARQRTALFASQLSALAADAERRALEAAQSRRSHDVRSVLMAVQTAGQALQERIARLSDEDRRLLTSILGEGVRELDRYFADKPEAAGEIPVGELGGWLRQRAQERGVDLAVDVPEGLLVLTSASLVRDVLSVMLEAVSGTCPLPLQLRASSEEGGVRLRLGPQAAQDGPEERAARFKPAVVREAKAGTSLEVLVAAEVARRAGGRLEHATMAGGLTSVTLHLPSSPAGVGVSTPPERPAGAAKGDKGSGRRGPGGLVRSSA